MVEIAAIIHYGALALTTILTGLGVALGQGRITDAALKAIYTQPQVYPPLMRSSILALALTETAGFLGLVIVVTLFFHTSLTPEYGLYISIAQAGMICAVGLAGFAASLAAAWPASAAMASIARQPFFADNISNLMLITVSIIQTPLLFGVIITFLIHFQQSAIVDLSQALQFCAAAVCTGIGAIGPAMGQGLFARSACQAIALNRAHYKRIFSFAIISQSLIETPILLAFITSLLIILRVQPHTPELTVIATLTCAACIGITNIVPSISSGRISAAACNTLGTTQNAGHANTIVRASILAQTLIDTIPLYGFIVGIILITLIAV